MNNEGEHGGPQQDELQQCSQPEAQYIGHIDARSEARAGRVIGWNERRRDGGAGCQATNAAAPRRSEGRLRRRDVWWKRGDEQAREDERFAALGREMRAAQHQGCVVNIRIDVQCSVSIQQSIV